MSQRPVSPALRYGALGVAVLGVSFSAIFIRLSDAPPLTIAAGRMLFAVLLLLPALLLVRPPDLGQLTRRDALAAVVSGLFLAIHFGLWTISLSYTTVASSVVFVSTHPIFVALAELAIFKHGISRLGAAGIGLTMMGSVVIVGGDIALGGTALFGDALAVGGAVAMVGYLIIGRQLRRRLGFLTYSLLVYSACWAALVVWAVVQGVSLLEAGPRDVLVFFALALVSTIGGHTIFNWALRHVSASVVAVAFVGEPVVVAALAWALLGEPVLPFTAVGGALILFGIYATARGS